MATWRALYALLLGIRLDLARPANYFAWLGQRFCLPSFCDAASDSHTWMTLSNIVLGCLVLQMRSLLGFDLTVSISACRQQQHHSIIFDTSGGPSNFHMVLAGRLFSGLLTCRKVSEDGCVAGKSPKLTFFVENKNSHQSFRLIPGATRNLKYNFKSFQHNLPVGLKRWAHFERSHLQERNQGAIHSCKRWLLLHVLLRFLKISETLCSPAYLELPWNEKSTQLIRLWSKLAL